MGEAAFFRVLKWVREAALTVVLWGTLGVVRLIVLCGVDEDAFSVVPCEVSGAAFCDML